jgi:hypothetical protein
MTLFDPHDFHGEDLQFSLENQSLAKDLSLDPWQGLQCFGRSWPGWPSDDN